MNEYVLKISRAVRDAGGRAMLVGGGVRDQLFGLDPKDFDLEVYYLAPPILRSVLKSLARVNTVGEHFAVYKLVFYSDKPSASGIDRQPAGDPTSQATVTPNLEPPNSFEIDVSIPRRESKSGKGHRGFVITGDPFMSFEEAARRRDFTINAIMLDPLTGEMVDPFGGVTDLQNRVLRVVAPETFVEDSLRVLRAMQLAARFEMTIDPKTVVLCRSIDLSDLPRERVWGEVEKLLLIASRPSIGIQAARNLGVLDQLFPQLNALVTGTFKDSQALDSSDRLLPSGAFDLTKRRLDEAAKLISDLPKGKRLAVMLAALCLDFESAQLEKPEPVESFLNQLGLYTVAGYNVREQIIRLVREHQKPREFFKRGGQISDGDFRRLAQRVDINLLYRLAKADALARGDDSITAEKWFIERTRALGVEGGAPAPLLSGRHLVEAGMQPSKRMGKILRQVYELQLDGTVTSLEEARLAAQQLIANDD